MRLLLHFPWGWLVGVMSGRVHTPCSSHMLAMAAETRLVLCQIKQAKDYISSRTQKWDGLGKIWKMCPPCWSLSWKKRAWKVWCTGSQLFCLTLSPLEPSSLAKPPRSPCYLSTGRLPQAQVLSLYILGALDIVKMLLDAFGKLCRTWLILDSAFPKFVLSMRSLSDFISLVPRLFLPLLFISF